MNRRFLITPNYLPAGDGAIVEGLVPESDVVFGYTFWDSVEYLNPAIAVPPPVVYGRIVRELEEAGHFRNNILGAFGSLDFIMDEGDHFTIGPHVRQAFTQTIFAHLETENANKRSFTLSERSRLRLAPRENYPSHSLIFKLNNLVPLPDNIENVAKFIDWKNENRDLLRRILGSAYLMQDRIPDSTSLDDFAEQVAKELLERVEELKDNASRRGLTLKFGSAQWIVRPNKTTDEFFAEVKEKSWLPSLFFGAKIGALIGVGAAARSSIEIERRAVRPLVGALDNFPYEAYLQALPGT